MNGKNTKGERSKIGSQLETGSICQRSGSWRLANDANIVIRIEQGQPMPPFMDTSVTWVLIKYDKS